MNYRKRLTLSLALGSALRLQIAGLYGAKVPEGVLLSPRQHLRVDLDEEPLSLDPHHSSTASEDWIIKDLYEGLTLLDEQGKLIPGTASHWEHDESCTTWTFYIRPTARWSHSGPVLAQDFVFAWQRLATEGKWGETLHTDLHVKNAKAVREQQAPPEALGVEAVDAHTLRVYLDRPMPALHKLLTSTLFVPLNRGSLIQKSQRPDLDRFPIVCNGAYRSPKYFPNEKVALVRNAYYWDDQHTQIDQVEFFFKENKPVKYMRFHKGEVDITNVVADKKTHEKLKQQCPETLKYVPSLAWSGIMLNTEDPALSHPALRKALNLVIDRDWLLRVTIDQGDQPTYGFLPPPCDPALPAWLGLEYEARCELARTLLETHGLRGENLPPLELLYFEEFHELAYALQFVWLKQLGVKVRTRPKPFEGLLALRQAGKYQMAMAGFLYENDDPVSALTLCLPGSGRNESRYNSPQYQALLRAASEQTSEVERVRYCQQANLLLAEDAPCIPLCFATRPYLINPKVGGWSTKNCFRRFYSKDLYIQADAQT